MKLGLNWYGVWLRQFMNPKSVVDDRFKLSKLFELYRLVAYDDGSLGGELVSFRISSSRC